MKRLVMAALLASFGSIASAQSLAGLWDATVNVEGTQIPFRFGLSGSGSDVKGWFFNGDEREISTSGTFENGSLVLNFDSYAGILQATVKDGVLDGQYSQRGKSQAIHATRALPRASVSAKAPDIGGLWFLQDVKSTKKGEKAWRLIVRQNGNDVSAAILRVDGDTGTLTGSYRDGKFVLSHFSGARPALLFITPRPDGTLAAELAGTNKGIMTALRPTESRVKGLPEPTDADKHTGVKDPSQPLAFSFPDLNGKLVSNADPRFRNKVLLINITGSWCPNCHDEAPFLAEMYRKYRDQGLEIVALSFEEPEQLTNPTRLRAFIQKHGIQYTVLLGGETKSAAEKLTNALDWDAWPTTFFVGRDGLVKHVHAGFPSPGSGELYRQAKQSFITKVEGLLGQNRLTKR